MQGEKLWMEILVVRIAVLDLFTPSNLAEYPNQMLESSSFQRTQNFLNSRIGWKLLAYQNAFISSYKGILVVLSKLETEAVLRKKLKTCSFTDRSFDTSFDTIADSLAPNRMRFYQTANFLVFRRTREEHRIFLPWSETRRPYQISPTLPVVLNPKLEPFSQRFGSPVKWDKKLRTNSKTVHFKAMWRKNRTYNNSFLKLSKIGHVRDVLPIFEMPSFVKMVSPRVSCSHWLTVTVRKRMNPLAFWLFYRRYCT